MKRVLYIFLGDFDTKSGVTNKLKGLLSALDEKNTEWVLFTVSAGVMEPGYTSRNQYSLPLRYEADLSGFYAQLDNFIRSNPAFDIYFFRYPAASRALVKFLKAHPGKLVFEHNTKELPEIKESGLFWVRKYKARLSPSYFKLLMKSLIRPVFNEAIYGRQALKLAKKGVAVTHEIARYEMNRCKSYSCTVLSNGIDVRKTEGYVRELRNGDVLNLIMLVSYNTGWHGVDLVVESLNRYKGSKIRLYLIGHIKEELIAEAKKNKNIILTGFLSAKEFEAYIRKAHLGIGSLALFRINMEEASTLKVREYLATGLPVCLGYTDTDIEASPGLKTRSLVINAKEAIDWDQVYDWTVNLYKEENLNTILREEAFRQLDFSNKAQILLAQ